METTQKGRWTLRCHACQATFEVELAAVFVRILQYVIDTPCHGCKKKPTEPPETSWHEIIKYEAVSAKPD
jgi:rRNA maturation endonuclease Nob1